MTGAGRSRSGGISAVAVDDPSLLHSRVELMPTAAEPGSIEELVRAGSQVKFGRSDIREICQNSSCGSCRTGHIDENGSAIRSAVGVAGRKEAGRIMTASATTPVQGAAEFSCPTRDDLRGGALIQRGQPRFGRVERSLVLNCPRSQTRFRCNVPVRARPPAPDGAWTSSPVPIAVSAGSEMDHQIVLSG